MGNLHLTFDWHYIGQKKGEYFAKFCGLLRIYELYNVNSNYIARRMKMEIREYQLDDTGSYGLRTQNETLYH